MLKFLRKSSTRSITNFLIKKKRVTKEYGGNTGEGCIGRATGISYVGAVGRAEEYNYITLCGHGGSKV